MPYAAFGDVGPNAPQKRPQNHPFWLPFSPLFAPFPKIADLLYLVCPPFPFGGGGEQEKCPGKITKDTKSHEDSRSRHDGLWEPQISRILSRFRGVLAHAELPGFLEHKGTRRFTQRITEGNRLSGMWSAATHSGRERFSLHPRHVCDVPMGSRS